MQWSRKKDSNFSIDEFKAVHNSDLVNKFGNFVNRTLKFKGLEKIEIGNLDKEIKCNVIETYKNVSDYIKKLEFRNAIQEILCLVELGNKYYDDKKLGYYLKKIVLNLTMLCLTVFILLLI